MNNFSSHLYIRINVLFKLLPNIFDQLISMSNPSSNNNILNRIDQKNITTQSSNISRDIFPNLVILMFLQFSHLTTNLLSNKSTSRESFYAIIMIITSGFIFIIIGYYNMTPFRMHIPMNNFIVNNQTNSYACS